MSEQEVRTKKDVLLDEIVAFLFPEAMDPPPQDHPFWEPGDEPYSWDSDTLMIVSDMIIVSDLYELKEHQ